MDSFDKENEVNQAGEEELLVDEDFGHTDKVIGLFTSPTATFERIARFPPKALDWVIPLVMLILLVIVSNLVMMNNQEIAYQIKQKQIEASEKGINQAVAEGKMTKEQADAQMTRMEDYFNSPLAKILSTVGILVVITNCLFYSYRSLSAFCKVCIEGGRYLCFCPCSKRNDTLYRDD